MNPKSIAAFFLIFTLIGCSTSQKGKASTQSVQDETLEIAKSENTAESKDYQSIDRLYREKKYPEAVNASKKFAKTHPDSKYLEQAFHFKALSEIALKQYVSAQSDLKKTIDIAKSRSDRNNSLIAMAEFNLAFSHYELSQYDQSMKTLQDIDTTVLSPANFSKYHVLKAKIFRSNQDHLRCTEELFYAIRISGENAAKSYSNFLSESLDRIEAAPSGLASLEKLSVEFEDSQAADHVLFRLANQYLKIGKPDKAKAAFERLVANFPASIYAAQSKEVLKIAQHSSVVDSQKVGVILTLSGKFGKIGQRSLQSIQQAFRIYNGSKSDPNPLSLVVYDDQGDIERANQAIEELYYKHNVVGIIGPISSKLIEPLSKKAEILGIPLLTLAQKEAPHSTGSTSYVVSAGLTPNVQAHEIVRYATDKLGLKTFAMLSPNSKFGEEYTKAFWDELDRKNALVRGYETYADDETDFRSYIDKLVGLSATEARERELNELRALKQAATSKLKTKSKKIERLFDLKPVVDFEAVFIPDEPKILGQILPTFAYRDVDKVLFLGINTWNSSELIARAAQFANGSVFVDGFFTRSSKPAVQKFIEEYRRLFSQEPGLIEAISYDAANVIQAIVSKDSSISRAELKERLNTLKDFQGLSGPISSQDGHLIKTLHLLTLKGGKIDEIAF